MSKPDYHEGSARNDRRGLQEAQLQAASLWPLVFRRPSGERAHVRHQPAFAELP